MLDPADTVAASAVFVSVRLGHWTVMDAVDCAEAPLVVDAVAVLEYVAQLDEDVVLVTCTLADAPPARLRKLQPRVPLTMAQVPGPEYAGLMLQPTPAPVGRVSESVADVAVPVPLLVTDSVYPIGEPADTEAASAVLVSCRLGHCTVVDADHCTGKLFVADTAAVFE